MRSLRARLALLWSISLIAAIIAGGLIIGLFHQSATASLARDRQVAARACDSIARAYGFYSAGLGSAPQDEVFRKGLIGVAAFGLRPFPDVAGGIVSGGTALASIGVVTPHDAGISAATAAALDADHLVLRQRGGFGDRAVIAACPLGSPAEDLAGFTIVRLDLLRTPFSKLAAGGLAVLLLFLLVSAWFLTRLVLGFSRRLTAVEAGLATDPEAKLPLTGEPDFDRLIAALNGATARLARARARIAEQEKLASLGRMAAGLAHEIRNPLGAIRLRAESGLAGDAARRGAALDSILAESARLEKLTGKLLGFAAAPAPQTEEASLAHLFGEARAPLEEYAAAKGVTIETNDRGLSWTLDPALTLCALDNLLRNAIDACGEGDTVRLTAARDADGLTILIEDTGPGIAPGIAAHLFEPFVTGRPEGTGLGLAIAREMIHAQGGTLVHDPSEHGARFRIRFRGVS
ncbi:PAS domain-containing sensor histidine kinase [Acidiphilium sp.]|uniref:sensor histidine kinase n=1 Tax=Acidiphilium sp. TaxID=527 RepID=UPI00258A53AA|nr:HAMP domain-containing sensor histidine kinase [Acidiphilium sp.]